MHIQSNTHTMHFLDKLKNTSQTFFTYPAKLFRAVCTFTAQPLRMSRVVVRPLHNVFLLWSSGHDHYLLTRTRMPVTSIAKTPLQWIEILCVYIQRRGTRLVLRCSTSDDCIRITAVDTIRETTARGVISDRQSLPRTFWRTRHG